MTPSKVSTHLPRIPLHMFDPHGLPMVDSCITATRPIIQKRIHVPQAASGSIEMFTAAYQ
jgi:hypothetical protein